VSWDAGREVRGRSESEDIMSQLSSPDRFGTDRESDLHSRMREVIDHNPLEYEAVSL
jgi:hypothetical protein